MAAPVPAGMVLVPTARRGEEAASRLGAALVDAAKAPIFRSKTIKTFVDEDGNPTAREREVGIPAWLIAALSVVGAATMARGLRTGVVQMADWYQVSYDTREVPGVVVGALVGSAQPAAPVVKHHTKTVTVAPGQVPALPSGAFNGRFRFLARRPIWNAAPAVRDYPTTAITGVSLR